MNAIAVVDRISGNDFYQQFVLPKKPVLIRKMTEDWDALKIWDMDYFRKIGENLPIVTKTANVVEGKKISMDLAEFVNVLDNYEKSYLAGEEINKPPYLHDLPLFNILPSLAKDLGTFPLELFPEWYWKNWPDYIQFFMGGTGSLTPLHFDTLLTNNIFFQIIGKKRFILIDAADRDKCYIEGWRWSKFDPNNPDYTLFKDTKGLNISEVEVGPGDILYMPPGMLHQVHGLSYSVSFNIDWHTTQSAYNGILTAFQGAPKKNIYYNFLIYMGLKFKIPSKYIMPYYKTYLSYVS